LSDDSDSKLGDRRLPDAHHLDRRAVRATFGRGTLRGWGRINGSQLCCSRSDLRYWGMTVVPAETPALPSAARDNSDGTCDNRLLSLKLFGQHCNLLFDPRLHHTAAKLMCRLGPDGSRNTVSTARVPPELRSDSSASNMPTAACSPIVGASPDRKPSFCTWTVGMRSANR
jgi:hypothetical protein